MQVTIIIPMRNEQAHVGQCLESILPQLNGPHEYEVLCVDGASTDRTAEVVGEYAERDGRVRLVPNPRKIAPCGMNLGIDQAAGDAVLVLGCHAEYAADYVAKCLEVLDRTGADVVGGYIRTVPGSDTPAGRAIAAATSSRFGVGGAAFRTGGDEREVDTVAFGCHRRDVFDRFGRYNERLVRNQDIELNSRIRKGGGRIVISPEIRLSYYNRATYSGLRQQAFSNGLWCPYTVYIAGGGLRVRHFVPMLFVASLLVLGVVGAFWQPAWWALAAELALYLAALTVASVRSARRHGADALYVALAFVQLHLAYGVGSLWGALSGPFVPALRRPGVTRRKN